MAMSMQPIRPQDATSIYQRQAIQGAGVDASGAPRRAGGADGADGTRTRRTDRVTVSPAAQELYRAMQAVNAQGDVRDERVAALRAQIESGTYRVDANGIARRLVEDGFGS
jgi:negative regulator of flagellin synthesis FlgM